MRIKKNITPQEYYDVLRKQGFTDDITSDPEPNYKLDFYQNIFNVMEGYARKYHEEKLKEELIKAYEANWSAHSFFSSGILETDFEKWYNDEYLTQKK